MDASEQRWWKDTQARWKRTEQRRAFATKWMRRLKLRLFGKIAGTLLAIYIIAFLVCFDVLSGPVGNEKHGWLGPLIRGDKHSVDFGKIYDYQSDDLSYYHAF